MATEWMIGPLDLSLWAPLVQPQLRMGVPADWLALLVCLLGLALVWATFTDLFRGRRIPNLIPYVGLPFGLLALPLVVSNPKTHLICGLAVGGLFFCFALMQKMGMGDVKLAATLALLFGGGGVAMVILTYLLAGVLVLPWAVWMAARRRSVRKARVPMAPFFLAGYLATLPGLGVRNDLTLALAGLGLLVAAAGAIEQRLRPLPTLERISAEFLASDGSELRVVPGNAPQVRVGDDFLPLDDLPKLQRGWLEHLLLGRLLSYEQEMALLRTGETPAQITLEDERTLAITVRELRNGSVMFEAAK